VLPGRLLARGGYAVVDVEATGSSSRRHRVVELAVVLLDGDFEPEGEFSTLVDPEGPVGPTHIHGIESRHVEAAGAPLFGQIAPRLLGLLRGRVLVGHNVGCDRAFLAAEYGRLGVEFPAVPELCTMRMAALREPAPRGLSLLACADAAGLADWTAHTALGDARTTARLFASYVQDHPHGPAQAERALARAEGVEWPRLAGADALWVGRRCADRAPARNVPSQQMVSYVPNGGA
jgi:DNA polymerase-3 subunit epsilon